MFLPSIRRLSSLDDLLDASILFSLLSRVFEEDQETLPPSYLARLLTDPSLWIVAASVDHTIVGGLTAYLLPMYRRPTSEVFLYDIAVSPPFQRQGIGRLLVDFLRRETSALGASPVFVAADNEDLHALDFYRNLGGLPLLSTFFTFPHDPSS